MQTIQILFLLLDGIIKLAPWRIVTEAMDRIGYGASESLARSLGVIAVFCAGLCALPPTPIIAPLLLTGYHRRRDGVACTDRQSVVQPHSVRILSRRDVCGGLWLRDRKLRASMPLRS